MTLTLVTTVDGSKTRSGEIATEYVGRIARFTPCSQQAIRTEAKLSDFVSRASGRSRAVLILTDSSGKQVSSPELAEMVRQFRDGGCQQLVFAVGPANGWSQEMLLQADGIIAFGRITLPHELAAVILAEQVYRAMTIIAGHPYHIGH